MVGEEKKEDENDRPYWYYFSRGGQEEEKEPNPHEGFRVVADVENNRLLLRANEAEMTEVRSLLAELGELPADGHGTRTVRFIEPGGDAARARLLEQIRRIWPAMGDNQLIIDAPEKTKPATPDEEKPAADDSEDEPLSDRSASSAGRPRRWMQLAQLQVPATNDSSPEAAPHPDSKPPAPSSVAITVTPDGRLMLSSPDTAALDRLEQLIGELTPSERRFKVFRLRYVTATTCISR